MNALQTSGTEVEHTEPGGGGVVGYFKCKETVYMKRSGEFIGQYGFVNGRVYPCIGIERDDLIFINEGGGTHVVPADFLKKHFEPVDLEAYILSSADDRADSSKTVSLMGKQTGSFGPSPLADVAMANHVTRQRILGIEPGRNVVKKPVELGRLES